MQSNQFQYSCMCRLNVVWRLHSAISGKAYRFHGGNYCTHNDLQTRSRECQFLQDNDMTTCELVPNGARVMFGLFVKEPRRRSIFVSVYGKGILCNPVYGISLTIISTDRESHACKAYFTESAHSCTHECRCPQDRPCSHMTIVIYPKAFADGVTEICEIKIWTGSSGTSIISAKYLVIIWSMQIRMSEVFDVDLNSDVSITSTSRQNQIKYVTGYRHVVCVFCFFLCGTSWFCPISHECYHTMSLCLCRNPRECGCRKHVLLVC